MSAEKNIRISEIFGPTIQGEGILIGQPTVFVRTGGCDYRCTWCDTPHAVDSEYRAQWTPMSPAQIMAQVEALSGGKPLMITLSGGNPAIQPLAPLIKFGKARGYRFAMETQGSIVQDWFADLDCLVLSPKPPSSGMKTDMEPLEACVQYARAVPSAALKFVVFDEADYTYARDIAARFKGVPVYLQPGNHALPPARADIPGVIERLRWLAEQVTQDRWFEASVLPQLHVLLWGNLRGV